MAHNRAYCRIYQWIMNIGIKFVNFKTPKLVEGVDSFHSIPDILNNRRKWAPMIITGPFMGSSKFVEALLEELSERAVLYNKVKPDPTSAQVEEMVNFYNDGKYERHCRLPSLDIHIIFKVGTSEMLVQPTAFFL